MLPPSAQLDELASVQLPKPDGVIMKKMSRFVVGRCSAAITRSSSVSSWPSVRHTVQPGPVGGSEQPLGGNGSVSTTAPPYVESYAAGPEPSRYCPLRL